MIMEENKRQTEIIDLRLVLKKIWANRKLFYIILPITFVLSCIYILGVPRYYVSDAKLAPEVGNNIQGGTLGSLATTFGINISEVQSSDAITPLLYPDLMEDNGFVTSLFNIKVKSKDGKINTTYYDYLQNYQKHNIWLIPLGWLKNLLKSEAPGENTDNALLPYHLSKNDDDIAQAIRGNIKFGVDKKNGIISISAKAQDPLVCSILADSVQERLKHFITEYRTNKARTDYMFYQTVTSRAKEEYEKVRRQYAYMSDGSTNITIRSVEMRLEDLENDMQLKFSAYTNLNTQLQAARAKVQERTPVFTVLKGAAEPIKPAGPKRMIFVAAMVLLAFVGTIIYIFFDEIKKMSTIR